MKTLLIINNKDLTDYVIKSSYAVSMSKEYNEWKDANYKTHRDYERSRINGSMDLTFINGYANKMSITDFLANLEAATDNNVVSMAVYCLGELKPIYAYVDIETTEHYGTETQNYDKINLSFMEL